MLSVQLPTRKIAPRLGLGFGLGLLLELGLGEILLRGNCPRTVIYICFGASKKCYFLYIIFRLFDSICADYAYQIVESVISLVKHRDSRCPSNPSSVIS